MTVMVTARAHRTWLWDCPLCGATAAASTVPTADQCADCGAVIRIEEDQQ